MVEGACIDKASHDNKTIEMFQEAKLFDHAVGAAMEFAEQDRETLVVVTADHETGGLALFGDMPLQSA